MPIHEEGYIKYQGFLEKSQTIIPRGTYEKINNIRTQLWNKKYIGSYADGIGYGNISIRDEEQPERFYITGTATGHLKETGMDSWVRVDRWNLLSNCLWCTGPIKASSESLSHAVIYENSPEVQCVIHIHHQTLWEKSLSKLPCTPLSATYGTPEMAASIKDLIIAQGNVSNGLFVMGGHEEGLLAFGSTPRTALNTLLDWAEKML